MAPRRRARSLSRSRSRAGGSSRRRETSGRCYKAGPVTCSPFFNYVRTVRQRMRGARLTEITKRAGAEWRRMSDAEKQPFYRMAEQARRDKRRRR